MTGEYEVHLWEDTNKYENGKLIHHVLNGFYNGHCEHGQLAFAGDCLSGSSLLTDVRVFYLEFHGDSVTDKEEWANHLRAQVLSHLRYSDWNWYMSFVGSIRDSEKPSEFITIEDDLRKRYIENNRLDFIFVQVEEQGCKFDKRLFVEIPDHLLTSIVTRYWSEETEFYPIQGFQLPPRCISRFDEWDKRPRDDQLFRDVMDQSFIAFYTFPSENRYFVFLTNKLDIEDVRKMIQLDDLQKQAREIGKNCK